MIEAIVISLIVGFAALHVAFRLLPKPFQQKIRGVMAAGLKKIGLDAIAKRFAVIPRAANKACGSGCDRCGTQVAVESKAKVMQFHPRLR